MKKNINLLKIFIFTTFIFGCTQNLDLNTLKNTSNTKSSNLTPKGGGTIDPKISAGVTIINFKRGDSNLVFNINLSNAPLSTKANDEVKNENNKVENNNEPKLGKLNANLKINDDKFDIKIPSDKITDNKHSLNLVGLEKGDKVSLDVQAYDQDSKLINEKTIKDKEVKTDFEQVDVNLSINIQVNVSQKVEQNQVQTVIGPTININIPSIDSRNCYGLKQPESSFIFNGKEILVCKDPKTATGFMDGKKCYIPGDNNSISLEDGTKLKLCN
ncbi:MAG: hypothetical protein U0457_00055 [Candidatus Sericytochromatia bacterium]